MSWTLRLRALALHQEIGDASGVAYAWDSVGFAHHQLGEYDQAIACYQRALEIYREIGERYYEADTMSHLGDTHHTIGDTATARGFWRQALAVLDEIGHHDADRIRAKLDDTPPG
jgi:tetratricopeptide (TPR) repeat protein